MEDLFQNEIWFDEITERLSKEQLKKFDNELKMIEYLQKAFSNFKRPETSFKRPEIKKENVLINRMQSNTWFENLHLRKEIKKCHGQQSGRHLGKH